MTDPLTSARMRNTKGRNNSLEVEVRRLLHARGLRFRVHYPLPEIPRRTSDIAFPSLVLAVFIDGCFWHSCPDHATRPKANSDYWAEKLASNVRRDRDTDDRLRAQGWFPLRFWAHETAEHIADTIASVVQLRQMAPHTPEITCKATIVPSIVGRG